MRKTPAVAVEAGGLGFVTEAGPGEELRYERLRSLQQAHIGRLDASGACRERAGERRKEQGEEIAQHGRLEALHGGR